MADRRSITSKNPRRASPATDLTGQRFGRLVMLERAASSPVGKTRWQQQNRRPRKCLPTRAKSVQKPKPLMK